MSSYVVTLNMTSSFFTSRGENSFRLPKVAKDCPSLPDLTISTSTTTTTHNEGIILQSNQSNSTEQKKTNKNNSCCLQLTFNDWLIIIDCQILLQHWVHSQCQMCSYFPDAECPVTFPTPAILVFLPAPGN